jgi:aminopeptidase N
LFTDYHFGKDAGDAYVQGTRKLIRNDAPIIGKYGVNDEGSGDMYYKGGNLLHYLRQLFDNDEKFRSALREMNKVFYHQTVTSDEVEHFLSVKVGRDLRPFFDQYLRNRSIPTLEIQQDKSLIKFRWSDCIESFNAPVKIEIGKETKWIYPTTNWKSLNKSSSVSSISIDKNFYVGLKILN